MLEITKMLMLSTAHMTADDANKMENQFFPVSYTKHHNPLQASFAGMQDGLIEIIKDLFSCSFS